MSVAAAEFIKWLEVFNVDYGPNAGTGTVNTGAINEIAYYAAAGDAVSGLATANNGLLVTSATGVPSIGNDILGDITVNGIYFGKSPSVLGPNIFIGSTGSTATSARYNTIIGTSSAGASITSGNNNVGLGENVLSMLTSAVGNSAFGANCLRDCDGSKNSGLGNAAMVDSTTATENTGVGHSTGRNVAAGAVALTTGSQCTFIGFQASSDATDSVGVLSLGTNAVAPAATGATSSDDGAGVALGSASYPIGFRGDGTIYPSAGSIAGYMQVKVNGTLRKIALYALS